MTTAAILAYTAALLLAVATPGPAMLAVISASVVRGARPGIVMGLGVAAADVLLAVTALLGITALMATFAFAATVIKVVGGAYLIWLGIKMWRQAGRADLPEVGGQDGALRAGFVLGISNPKAILFHASLMPLFFDLSRLALGRAAVVALIVAAINVIVMSLYAILADRAGGWVRTPARMSVAQRAGGASMVGIGGAVMAR